jgi:hypothetical protein
MGSVDSVVCEVKRRGFGAIKLMGRGESETVRRAGEL